jgi:hypothetical protein
LREGLAVTRALRFTIAAEETDASRSEASWRAKITVSGGGEYAQSIVERMNSLATPFELRWRRVSGKPWDWKLIAVSNPQLELPDQF